MSAHPAGPRHAEEFHHSGVPPRPATKQELLELAPNVWPHNAVRGDDGVISIAGVTLNWLAQEYGTPLFVVDEADFRSRCREIDSPGRRPLPSHSRGDSMSVEGLYVGTGRAGAACCAGFSSSAVGVPPYFENDSPGSTNGFGA